MQKDLYWLDGPWPGKLAVAARPRGGDWLRDDLAKWKQQGVDALLSLLTPEEEDDLDLRQEAIEAKRQGMDFVSFPIHDRRVPGSEARLAGVLERITCALSEGRSVVVHCRQGIGRSGLVAACLLIRKGISPGSAVETISAARGVPVPETSEQRDWIDHYAVSLAATK